MAFPRSEQPARRQHLSDGVTSELRQFLTEWHRVVSEKDLGALPGLLADDISLGAPPYWARLEGRELVQYLLGLILETIEDFRYHREWQQGSELALEFRGRIAGLAGRRLFQPGKEGRNRVFGRGGTEHCLEIGRFWVLSDPESHHIAGIHAGKGASPPPRPWGVVAGLARWRADLRAGMDLLIFS